MIYTPKLSQIPFDALIFGGAGYVLGRLAHVNAQLSAKVLVVGALANQILFAAANHWTRPFLNQLFYPHHFSPEGIYIGTNALVATITILAANHLSLISRRVAGACLFVSASILVARLSHLK